MSLDALVLALASVIRLTSVASVYAMLSAARPTRLLTAYITAGFVFSAAIGIVLVTVLDTSHTGGTGSAPDAGQRVHTDDEDKREQDGCDDLGELPECRHADRRPVAVSMTISPGGVSP